jgi:hypothetical protein
MKWNCTCPHDPVSPMAGSMMNGGPSRAMIQYMTDISTEIAPGEIQQKPLCMAENGPVAYAH